MLAAPAPVSVSLVPPDTVAARRVLRAYFDEIVTRYHRRKATAAEIDRAIIEEPSDDLAPPGGLFWVATAGTAVVGCVGLRFVSPGVGEVTRMFVAAGIRRAGVASRLLGALEQAARTHGLSRLRLDTRHDLVEARELYAKHGYKEVAAFNAGVYAEHWLAKDLV